MDITYKREIRHNYMIVEPDRLPEERYVTGMLSANCMEGILKFHLKTTDNSLFYYYEITSRQPMARLLETHSLTFGELRCFITGLAHAIEETESYLLSENQILLEPEYVFVTVEDFSPKLCMIPGRDESFPESMKKLLQYILGKIDHSDKECVILAYGLYQASLKENYSLDDLMVLVGRKEEPAFIPEFNQEGSTEQQEVYKDQEDRENWGSNEKRYDKESWNRKNNWNGKEDKIICERGQGRYNAVSIHSKGHVFGWIDVAAGITVAAGGPGICWLLGGTGFLLGNLLWLAAADGLYLAFLCYKYIISYHGGPKGEKQKKQEDRFTEDRFTEHQWLMEFDDDETEDKPVKEKAVLSEDICQTVLLSGSSKVHEGKMLKSISKENEDIKISYVPYLIGRQEGLADYVLNRDGISRLHAKIDKQNEVYYITDLNSTNGTRVNGRELEANETQAILPGDEVYIANAGYVFT